MAQWISFDYHCVPCDSLEPEVVDRADVPETLPCPECGGPRVKVFGGAHITKASFVDGTKRLETLKQARALRRAYREAGWRKDRAAQADVKREQERFSATVKTDKVTGVGE